MHCNIIKMKFFLALSALLSVATAVTEISSDSVLGQHLITKARKLEEEYEENAYWVSGYSVKFQGCHHIKQWNDEADGEEDVKIQTKRLVRFRLCPSESCSATKAAGCTSGYGDYIIDMDIFMEAYFEAKRTNLEYECEHQLNYVCNCDDENQDDNFNRDYCEYDCFIDAGMEECVDQNPYQQDEVEEFNIEDYMACQELKVDNNNNNRRLDQEEVRYYVGPYCANQGGSIHLGLFTDDTCTTFAEGVTFESLAGFSLPYSTESIVSEECMGCLEREDNDNDNNNGNNNNNNDQQDEDQVIESCEQLYMGSGKCEANLPSGMVYEVNNNACNYMQGIRIVRQDGIIDTGSSRPSAVATAFIVIFAMAFCAMAFYVWYLRTRLGIKKNTLL